MTQGAKVESIDSLKVFRVALIKFAETANIALGDAESEVQRVQMWLENEQQSYWQQQIRKRTEILGRAKEALRMKKVFKDASGSRQSYIDEEKAVQKATRDLQEAEQKLIAVKQWARKFQKEAAAYKGSVQRLSTFVLSDIPVAVSKLDRMAAALQAYVQLIAPTIEIPIPGAAGGSVAQAAPAPGAAPAEGTPADQPAEAGAAGAEAAGTAAGAAQGRDAATSGEGPAAAGGPEQTEAGAAPAASETAAPGPAAAAQA